MAGAGMGGSAEAAANGSQAPLGTEYTLQGARIFNVSLATRLMLL